MPNENDQPITLEQQWANAKAQRQARVAEKMKLIEDAAGANRIEGTDVKTSVAARIAAGEVPEMRIVGGVSRATVSDGRGGDEVAAAARLAGTVQPYSSRAEMQAVIRSKAYKRADTATHALHQARLALTDISASALQ